ncbi:Metapyrocatechase 2 [Pseudocercospora fuligena]|uniref:Metapyrocatechase 2 n=1 Tax=Pseudocercospora fuligena TaxID=685502 RepID=A0A8H6REX1_9PEZI|nr:Metapyrocatechase 2 [Pseudocercospora fuligena]
MAITKSMKIPDIKNNPSKVQLSRISHVYFEHPELEQFAKFAEDFGFAEAHRTNDRVYYRGYGKDPYVYVASQSKDGQARFMGAAFVAQNATEFTKASQLPGASPKRSLNDAPGGGEIITFARPDSTFFHIVFGQTERNPEPSVAASATHISQGPYNTPFTKPRKGKFQRYDPGPALVHKLGHFGYVSANFDEDVEWYTSNFNIVPTDILHSPEDPNIDVLTFMHLDLGTEYSDHHSMFLSRAPPAETPAVTQLHHTSYEVSDFDEQLLGHQFLASKGWESVWGVGRHILGSQIFDYWKDCSGFKIEHYADGDIVNEKIEAKRDVAGPVSVWAPEMPSDFGVGFELPAH